MTVGERIRAARKEKGLTQKALGEACGIAEPTIRRYELGKLNPKYETLEKIACALETTASELMGIGIASAEFWLEKHKKRELLLRGLDVDLPLPAHFLKYTRSALSDEDLEFIGDIESISAVQQCFQSLGFRVLYVPSSVIGDNKEMIINIRTKLVYIVDLDSILDMSKEILKYMKQELSKLFENAEEVLTMQKAVERGIIDERDLLPPILPDSETTPEDK